MSDKIKREVYRILLVLGTNRLSNSFMFAVYSVFLLSRGLNLFQIAMINLVYHITIPLLEAPTGAIADLMGRKRSYLLSNVLQVIGFLMYAFSHSFIGFVAAEFILAVSYTFASGCTDAHLWETVSAHATSEGLEEFETKDVNRSAQFSKEIVIRAAGAIGGSLGPLIASVNMSLPWLASAGGVVISSIFAYKLLRSDSENMNVAHASHTLVLPSIKKAIQQIRSSRSLKRQVVLSFLAGASMMPIFMYWAPYIKNLAKGSGWLSLSFAWLLIEGAILVGAYLSKRFARTTSDERITLWGTIVTASAIALLALSRQYYLALAMLIVVEAGNSSSAQSMTMGRQSAINDIHVKDEDSLRATILSIVSMSAEVGVVISLVIAGLLSQYYSISVAWFASAFVLAISVTIQIVWKRRG